MKNIFKNDEFDSLYSKVKGEVQPLLDKNQNDNNDKLSVDEIVMWQKFPNEEYIIIPTEKCPESIKEGVLGIIRKNNPRIK